MRTLTSFALFTLLVVVVLTFLSSTADAKLREGDCLVCLRNIEKFRTALGGEKTLEKIENGIRKACKGITDKADKRFCYYIGGSEDAATSLLRTISQPIKNHMPAEKICEKLKQSDGQICNIKEDKPKEAVDYSKVDFNKMRVKELREILSEWGQKCVGCNDKQDFLNKIKEHLPTVLAKQAKKEL